MITILWFWLTFFSSLHPGCHHEWGEFVAIRDGRIVVPISRKVCVKCWQVWNQCKHVRVKLAGQTEWGHCWICGEE